MDKGVSLLDLKKRTTRAFSIFAIAFLVAIALFVGLKNSAREDGVPWPLRKTLGFNAALGEKLVNPAKVDAKSFSAPPKEKPARVNGGIGLAGNVDSSNWIISVAVPGTEADEEIEMKFSLADILKLPKVEETTQFKCIEGWSEVMSFGGARFSDFLKQNNLGTRTGQEPDWVNRPQDLYRYVGLETPDGKYYVSIDMKSLMNPQALLAYEQNGMPLTREHGAPLRLYIPNKYGVKSLKRVGKIIFSDEPLPDYWGENGYDWFIGL